MCSEGYCTGCVCLSDAIFLTHHKLSKCRCLRLRCNTEQTLIRTDFFNSKPLLPLTSHKGTATTFCTLFRQAELLRVLIIIWNMTWKATNFSPSLAYVFRTLPVTCNCFNSMFTIKGSHTRTLYAHQGFSTSVLFACIQEFWAIAFFRLNMCISAIPTYTYVYTLNLHSMLQFTSCLTASTLSLCLLKMCLRTKSGPLNFFPLNGQRYLFSANFWVFTSTKRSTSVCRS